MLGRRNAIEISDTRLHSDVDRLIEVLDRVLEGAKPATDGKGMAADRTFLGRDISEASQGGLVGAPRTPKAASIRDQMREKRRQREEREEDQSRREDK